MKRTLAILLTIASMFTLCSCSGGNNSETDNVAETKAATDVEAETTAAIEEGTTTAPADAELPQLTLIGHSSVKIKTSDGTVVYIDPAYTKIDGAYDEPADLVLITHGHDDHNKTNLITQNDGCQVITYKEALPAENDYQSFEVDGIAIEAVAAQNSNHGITSCVGFVLTFDDIAVYHAGDTSSVDLIKEQLNGKTIDYALYPIDGIYNMDAAEATEFANAIGAKNNIPMHIMLVTEDYNDEKARTFTPNGALYMEYGSSIALK